MRTARLDLTLRFNRRAALGVGLAAAMTGVLPRWTARAESRVPEALQRRFIDWSRMATGYADLPAGTVQTFLEWALRSGATVEDLSGLDPDTYRRTPLEKRFLETWYTGLFKIDGSSETRSYDTTLMWQAAGIDPPPTSCGGTPDRWASAPSRI
jgi:hypothetical protein